MVSTKRRGTVTAIDGLRQAGSLKLVFPRTHAAPGLQAVLVNTAGGITGGDAFGVEATAGAGTELTLTTQAAERAYGAQPGETGRLGTRLNVAPGARLNWLPQETILFENSALHRDLHVSLEGDAQLLFAEPLVMGRAAMGERLRSARFHDRVEIARDGRTLFLDAIRLSGDISTQMERIGGGAGALASVLYVAPDAADKVAALRAVLNATSGASALAEDMLHARFLAPDSHALRQTLIPALQLLSPAPLPRTWMI